VDLREVWTSVVQPSDIDHHMADNGQAEANAQLLAEMVARLGLAPGARVLMPGAGTGQFLDYAPPAALAVPHWLFTDLNPAFLARLEARLSAQPTLSGDVSVDDAECPTIRGPLAAVVAVLLLEHVVWRRAVAAWAALGPQWIGCIIQRNDRDPRILSPGRQLTPSMERFRELAHPALVPETELSVALGHHGYGRVWRAERVVPDAKAMVALLFQLGPSSTAAA
jgi:hypothetical protein